MIDFQVWLLTLHPAIWTLFIVMLGAATAFFLFQVLRIRTDPHMKVLSDLAYACAAKIAGVPLRGSTPPVGLKPRPWKLRGVTIVGNYKWIAIFGHVLWDRILVLDNPVYIWPTLVHEMTHAVRRRAGKKSSELAAEAAEAVAYDKCGGPEVDELLKRL